MISGIRGNSPYRISLILKKKVNHGRNISLALKIRPPKCHTFLILSNRAKSWTDTVWRKSVSEGVRLSWINKIDNEVLHRKSTKEIINTIKIRKSKY